jgi:tRNA(Ile)-lysidine synthase
MADFFNQTTHHTLQVITNARCHLGIVHRPTVILGLSGGPDSVFLFRVLARLHVDGHLCLVAAHLDHEWRSTSGADAQFCADLCHAASVTLVNAKASALAVSVKANGSKEEVGRRLRRHFYELVRQQYNADFIVLAHHRQDQQETFFMRLVRGTTLNGLTCMKAIEGRYLRPLLEVDKTSIIDYLTMNHLPFRIDPTNEADAYLRNRIRKYVVPALKSIDPRFEQKLASTTKHLQEEDAYLQELTQEMLSRVFGSNNGGSVGNLPEFKKLHPVMQRRVLVRWLIMHRVPFSPSAAYLDEVLRFINHDAGGRHCFDTWSIVKKGQHLWLEQCSS